MGIRWTDSRFMFSSLFSELRPVYKMCEPVRAPFASWERTQLGHVFGPPCAPDVATPATLLVEEITPQNAPTLSRFIEVPERLSNIDPNRPS